jgi:hypothetical protein
MLETSGLQLMGCLSQIAERDFEISFDFRVRILAN